MTISDLRKFGIAGKLPRNADGGYPIVYYTGDGGELCADCANGENGSEASEDDPRFAEDPNWARQWKLIGADVYYEGSTIYCAHCNAEIESAYGDPEAEPTEPQEDDLTTTDHETFYQNGKSVLRLCLTANSEAVDIGLWELIARDRVWERLGWYQDYRVALRAYMDRVQFWPNVWFISDHGNAHLIDLTEGK